MDKKKEIKEHIILNLITYLLPMHIYSKVLSELTTDELDDFDKSYLALYKDIESVITNQIEDPTSALTTLITQYNEIINEYEDSILYRVMEALKFHNFMQSFLTERKTACIDYIRKKIDIDVSDLFELLDDSAFLKIEAIVHELDEDHLKDFIEDGYAVMFESDSSIGLA